jgi:enamine deaminase RidA (YjgF/YER057c/UK114 family)
VPSPLQRLRELGLELPEPPAPVASYIPTRLVPIGGGRALLYVSGQIPIAGGDVLHVGRVPDQANVEQARESARLCALNILAQAEAAAGLDNVEMVAQVTGWVACRDDFKEQPQIINAASDLLAEVLGEAGRHTRAAIGTNALPRGVTTEVAAVLVVKAGN